MSTFANRTRRSSSIPRALLARGKPYLLPLYGLLLASDLAREGITNSGSYRFADHLYRAVPSGRWGVGRQLDSVLLGMPSARSFRSRYLYARDAIVRCARARRACDTVRVLSVPCGIARELADAATLLRAQEPAAYARLQCIGLDLDREPLALSSNLIAERGLAGFTFVEGDALDAGCFPRDLDLVTSTGLAEFLSDAQLASFYANCASAVRPGGRLVTSATRRHPLSDYLLRNLGELHTHYRDAAAVTPLLRDAGFRHVTARSDAVGLQILFEAVR